MKNYLVSLALISMTLTACQQSGGGGEGAPKGDAPEFKVSAETYLSGDQFCKAYSEFTGKEFSKYVEVPKDYKDLSKGTLRLYTYSMSAFNPKLPTYIYVDGGPGQNTHGDMPNYFNGKMNELRFDQRGLGCSASPTYAEYKDASLYSSENTVLDMEEIRKAYGLAKWTVFGVSYGTVPATMYASKFPAETITAVLEGVIGRPNFLHDKAYKAEKLNLALEAFSGVQKTAIFQLIWEDTADSDTVWTFMMKAFFKERGMRQFRDFLGKAVDLNGQVNKSFIAKWRKYYYDQEHAYPHPQMPGAVDDNILMIVDCKNMNYMERIFGRLWFSRDRGFYTTMGTETAAAECEALGVKREDQSVFNIEDNKVTVPVYYFQGSHDGATQALGAREHWKVVPQGPHYFMFARKGGHNPNFARLEGKDATPALKAAQNELFYLAITDDADKVGIAKAVEKVNEQIVEFKWILMDNAAKDDKAFDTELEGINKVLEFTL